MRETVLTQEIVRELLDYDPKLGTFTWKKREQIWFASYRSMCSWNAKHAGRITGTCIPKTKDGVELYPMVTVLYESHPCHRIAFLWMKGYMPEELDHRNRNKKDFRWSNLREATRMINMQNKAISKVNTSGRVGVRETKWGTFEARITANKKSIALGNFATFDDAVKAREAAERRYGFTTDAIRVG